MENQKFLPSKKDDARWVGWTVDPSFLPLEDLEQDGYTLQELTDERGRYWKIVKKTLTPKP